MSYQIDNQEIGIYISGLIEREFKSVTNKKRDKGNSDS